MQTINPRFVFINLVVGWEGRINATHLTEKFNITRQAASTVLKQYRLEQHPNYLTYQTSDKAFIATEKFNSDFLANIKNYSFENYLNAISAQIDRSLVSNNHFACEVEAPLRNINPLQVRPIMRAIREQLAIDIGYISLSSPDYLDRIIEPHTVIFDGLRWHVRAYCRKNQAFRDFTLSRFNGNAIFEGKATNTITQDNLWHEIVPVVIEPDPRFNMQQQAIIAQDFQMHNNQKTILTRAALVNYLLRRLRIDSYKNSPEEQQIVLTQESRKHIAPYLPHH